MSDTLHSSECPYCREPMLPVAMRCPKCAVEIRGRFRATHFTRLSEEELAFLERYLLAGFSIKALAEESGMGYAAIRSRLDRLISRYQRQKEVEEEKLRILGGIERGDISPDEAIRALEALQSDGKGD